MTAEVRCPECGSMMTVRTARYGARAGHDFWGCSRYPTCKGSRNLDGSVAESRPRTATRPPSISARPRSSPPSPLVARTTNNDNSIRRGDLLVSSSNDLGPGKLVGKDGVLLVLEYFDTPGQESGERRRMSVPHSSLRRFKLKPEMRVFWLSDNRWRSGRILEVSQDRDIQVRSRDWDGFVAEKRLFVRWHRPLTDPVGFATGRLLESPLLADMRRPFLRAILRQRSASRGMRGALSSAIELHDHQLETAWRVLQDPVQRYLLADEVGLGKTIEAGIILRQLLLDNPRLSVQLVLPPFLIGQWTQELNDKFFIRDFPDASIRFSRNDEPETWAPSDMLVVDEAHNLASLAESAGLEFAERYTKLSELARETPRLLLLSATPALNNEPVFLLMLKILDPTIYAHVTVAQLRDRLASRAGLGRIFLGLQPTLPAILIRNRLNELRNELPDDPDVEMMLQGALEALEAGDRNEVRAAIDSIRMHVAEIYRVHRRMLRTRRTSALEATYRVTGRTAPKKLTIETSLQTESSALLEIWRQEVLAAREDDAVGLRHAARDFSEAVGLTFDPQHLAVWARTRTSASPGEQAALDRITSDLSFRNRRSDVARPIADALTYHFSPKDKVVVFCPTADLVTDLATELREFLPSSAVLEHRSTDSPTSIDATIRRFESTQTTGVLIADASAEEGRNFQFADLLVHIGLPPRANRLEQRIGRCDRWQIDGTAGTWHSLTAMESDSGDTFAAVWSAILTEGFGVFTASIASLQFAVDAATDFAWQHLLQNGIQGRESAVEHVKATLETEVGRIREQDALDSLEAGMERSSIYRQLQEFETDEVGFGEITHSLVAEGHAPGNLRFQVIGDPRAAVGRYEAFSRLPGRQLRVPLVSVERLEMDFLPLRDHSGTFIRSLAVHYPDTHLFRYGDPFVDAVSDFLWHDDRGRAFGMWRWIPDWGHGTQIAYRFDFAVESRSPAQSDDCVVSTTLIHRADEFFPPLIVTVWIDRQGRQVTDDDRLATLEAPYAKPTQGSPGGDFSLNRTRIRAAYDYLPDADWDQRWRQAEATAQELVAELPEFTDAVATGLSNAGANSRKRVRQLELRAARATGNERTALQGEIAAERAAGQALADAIGTPNLRLDSTGIVIIAGEELRLDDDV
ncbi:protein DpdE [Gordonia sp. NPDC062954]|uniref:protein DpdE n=1 Tax=Gordonia sp. NPDC062954 TaxID=3364003 RepID=UPI0037CC0385